MPAIRFVSSAAAAAAAAAIVGQHPFLSTFWPSSHLLSSLSALNSVVLFCLATNNYR